MAGDRRYLIDVGIRDLPFPMRVESRVDEEGQQTIGNISITARIMQEFEARWIDRFIRIVHQHRDRIGTKTLRTNIMDYVRELNASSVKIDFEYPFFVEKLTPVSGENCLVRYMCSYTAQYPSPEGEPKILFKIEIPVITTYPGSDPNTPGGLFGQLSVLDVEVESRNSIYPEDLVEIADDHALAPVYSFLGEEDQKRIIQRVHSEEKSSVVVTDEIRQELAKDPGIGWYSVRCFNYGMLHSYSTVITTEKSSWVPFSSLDHQDI